MNTIDIKNEFQKIIEGSNVSMLNEYYTVLKSYLSDIENLNEIEVFDYDIVQAQPN